MQMQCCSLLFGNIFFLCYQDMGGQCKIRLLQTSKNIYLPVAVMTIQFQFVAASLSILKQLFRWEKKQRTPFCCSRGNFLSGTKEKASGGKMGARSFVRADRWSSRSKAIRLFVSPFPSLLVTSHRLIQRRADACRKEEEHVQYGSLCWFLRIWNALTVSRLSLFSQDEPT